MDETDECKTKKEKERNITYSTNTQVSHNQTLSILPNM